MNSRSFSRAGKSSSRPPTGFSLVELLTVIAIIAILLTVGAVGLGGMTGGKNVNSAVTTAEALFAQARAEATGRATRACVLVDINDPSDRVNYLRRMVVAYEEIDPATNQPVKDKWVVTDRGAVLPDQVYFSKTYSKGGDGQTLEEITLSEDNVKKQFAGKYLSYKFTSEGISSAPGSTFVVGFGVRPGTNGEPRVTGSAKRDFGGFVVWRNGTTSLFRSPDQAGIPSSVTNF
ncbi:prepilin-type N-terminal cleavage/methylation domain-containing protein [Luteolibacter sp. LG18]|uniref:pilus assembly FimT family protein n=1 Tax=Luteolibacter sp. LG18 TaxID=2819286 RepID=UPI002B2F1071|nr:hypothetical protein llg_25590 [Luteolibacter sp. LG18]